MKRKYTYGVSFNDKQIRCEFYKTCGNLVEAWEIPTRTEKNGFYIVNDIAEAIQGHLAENRISDLDVEGVSLSLPKTEHSNLKTLRYLRPGWDPSDIERELSKETGFRVVAHS